MSPTLIGIAFVFVYFCINAIVHPQTLNPFKQILDTPIEPYVYSTPLKSFILTNPSIPQKTPRNITPAVKIPWGTTEKVADHTYRTYVGQDDKMGTPQEILDALNKYRQQHGQNTLSQDDKLCEIAKWRAEQQAKINNLDGHKGLKDYLEDPKHWEYIDLQAVGENASYGYILTGTHLIEWVFDADEEHRDNQLDPKWNRACAATNGSLVEVMFGRK